MVSGITVAKFKVERGTIQNYDLGEGIAGDGTTVYQFICE